jgi:hypothetical protein
VWFAGAKAFGNFTSVEIEVVLVPTPRGDLPMPPWHVDPLAGIDEHPKP